MSKKLTLNDIKKVKIEKTRPVTIEEWGGDIFVKRLTPLEYAKFQKCVKDDAPLHEFIMIFACDEDGNALFSEADREFLEGTPVGVLEPIFMIGVELLNANKAGETPAKN